jgi:hypothetical protein
MINKRHLPFFVFGFLLLFLIFLPNYYFHWDGLDYAWQLENAPMKDLFHRHHLLFIPICKLVFSLLESTGLKITGLNFLIGLNILGGLAFLWICYRIFKVLFQRFWFMPLLGTAFVAFSFIFGSYFRSPNIYILPIAIMAELIYRLVINLSKSGTFKVTNIEWLMLFIATLIHLTSILALPALCYAYIISRPDHIFKGLIANLSLFLASYLGMNILIFCSISHDISISLFVKWISRFANRDYWIFNEFSGLANIIEASFSKSLMSHKALFVAPVDRAFVRFYPVEKFPLPELLGEILGWFAFILIIGILIYGFILYRSNKASERQLSFFLLFWIIPYLILFQLFIPHMSCYRLVYVLPLFIFFLKGVERLVLVRQNLNVICTLFVILIFCNFAYGFLPESNSHNNPYYRFAMTADTSMDKDDIVLFHPQEYFYAVHLRYFSDCRVAFLRRFTPSDYPDIPVEKIWTNTEETAVWINSKFENVYLSGIAGIPIMDYEKFQPLFIEPSTPEIMLLSKSQLHAKENISIDSCKFSLLLITPFQPADTK